MARPVIAVDVDEVLCEFLRPLVDYHNDHVGAVSSFEPPRKLEMSDFRSYVFRDVWGGNEDESRAIVDAYLGSPYFSQLLVPGAVEVAGIAALSAFAELHIVTSRQLTLQPATHAFLEQHFPGKFASVQFGNHWGATGGRRSKRDMCRDVGALLLIDDNLQYAQDVCGAGMKCPPPSILFHKCVLLDLNYGWSAGTTPEGCRRVHSWLQVAAPNLLALQCCNPDTFGRRSLRAREN